MNEICSLHITWMLYSLYSIDVLGELYPISLLSIPLHRLLLNSFCIGMSTYFLCVLRSETAFVVLDTNGLVQNFLWLDLHNLFYYLCILVNMFHARMLRLVLFYWNVNMGSTSSIGLTSIHKIGCCEPLVLIHARKVLVELTVNNTLDL